MDGGSEFTKTIYFLIVAAVIIPARVISTKVVAAHVTARHSGIGIYE